MKVYRNCLRLTIDVNIQDFSEAQGICQGMADIQPDNGVRKGSILARLTIQISVYISGVTRVFVPLLAYIYICFKRFVHPHPV